MRLRRLIPPLVRRSEIENVFRIFKPTGVGRVLILTSFEEVTA